MPYAGKDQPFISVEYAGGKYARMIMMPAQGYARSARKLCARFVTPISA